MGKTLSTNLCINEDILKKINYSLLNNKGDTSLDGLYYSVLFPDNFTAEFEISSDDNGFTSVYAKLYSNFNNEVAKSELWDIHFDGDYYFEHQDDTYIVNIISNKG